MAIFSSFYKDGIQYFEGWSASNSHIYGIEEVESIKISLWGWQRQIWYPVSGVKSWILGQGLHRICSGAWIV